MRLLVLFVWLFHIATAQNGWDLHECFEECARLSDCSDGICGCCSFKISTSSTCMWAWGGYVAGHLRSTDNTISANCVSQNVCHGTNPNPCSSLGTFLTPVATGVWTVTRSHPHARATRVEQFQGREDDTFEVRCHGQGGANPFCASKTAYMLFNTRNGDKVGSGFFCCEQRTADDWVIQTTFVPDAVCAGADGAHINALCVNLKLGDGDCDKDSHCEGNLVCGKDNCGDYRDSTGWTSASTHSFDTTDDCCMEALPCYPIEGYMLYDQYGCGNRNEIFKGAKPRDDCAKLCSDDPECISFEWQEVHSYCTLSKSCQLQYIVPYPGHCLYEKLVCAGADNHCTGLKQGDGDCDYDDDCLGDLVCGTNNCGDFHNALFDSTDDCCEPLVNCATCWEAAAKNGACDGCTTIDCFHDKANEELKVSTCGQKCTQWAADDICDGRYDKKCESKCSNLPNGVGGCHSNGYCAGSLVCGTNNCGDYHNLADDNGYGPDDNCCMPTVKQAGESCDIEKWEFCAHGMSCECVGENGDCTSRSCQAIELAIGEIDTTRIKLDDNAFNIIRILDADSPFIVALAVFGCAVILYHLASQCRNAKYTNISDQAEEC